jgi:hypothetical protein
VPPTVGGGWVNDVTDVVRVSTQLINQLAADIRSVTALFYDAVLCCDDASCARRTRHPSARASNGAMACVNPKCKGKMYPRVCMDMRSAIPSSLLPL